MTWESKVSAVRSTLKLFTENNMPSSVPQQKSISCLTMYSLDLKRTIRFNGKYSQDKMIKHLFVCVLTRTLPVAIKYVGSLNEVPLYVFVVYKTFLE